MKDISFVGNGWVKERKKLNRFLKKQKKEEAQLLFWDWSSENIPAVPHHLVRKKGGR